MPANIISAARKITAYDIKEISELGESIPRPYANKPMTIPLIIKNHLILIFN